MASFRAAVRVRCRERVRVRCRERVRVRCRVPVRVRCRERVRVRCRVPVRVRCLALTLDPYRVLAAVRDRVRVPVRRRMPEEVRDRGQGQVPCRVGPQVRCQRYRTVRRSKPRQVLGLASTHPCHLATRLLRRAMTGRPGRRAASHAEQIPLTLGIARYPDLRGVTSGVDILHRPKGHGFQPRPVVAL
jgi:hypothetical protein